MSENSSSPVSRPITPEADDILETKNVVIIPNILANAGGCVTASYYEWIQHRQGENWPLEEVHKRLQAAMRIAAIVEAFGK